MRNTRKEKIGKAKMLSNVVSIRLSDAQLRHIDLMAEANNRTRSNQIQVLLSEALGERKA